MTRSADSSVAYCGYEDTRKTEEGEKTLSVVEIQSLGDQITYSGLRPPGGHMCR